MNWKVLVLLLAFTLALGAYLFLQDQPEAGEEAGSTELEYVLPYAPEDVQKVTIIFQDTTYVVVRDGLEWHLEQPDPGWGADSLVINHLLRTLSQMPYVNSIPVSELDMAAVKLDDPVLVFTAYKSDLDSTRLEFGALNPTTENIYILIAGQGRVALANKLLGPMMTVNGFLVRGKSLTGVQPYRTVGIEVESGGRSVFRCYRADGRDRWRIDTAGGSVLADKLKLNLRLGELYSDQVREFLPAGSVRRQETGLNRPVRTLRLVAENGDTSVVRLGRTVSDQDYLRWASSSIYPGHLLLIDSWLIERVDKFVPDSMRTLQIVDFIPSEVTFISLANPLDSLVLTAENDTLWRLIAPRQARAKYQFVEQLLSHADTLKGSKVLPAGGDRGFESPQVRLVLMNGDSLLVDMLVGYFAETEVYVRDNVRNIDFLASPRKLEPLNATFKDVADIPVRHVVE